MDRSTTDHSDSDSGDSWTLIEKSSTYADDAPDVPNHPTESNTVEHHDKDEDTDGISIISDSEPESSSPCEVNYEHYLLEENLAPEHHIPQFMTVNSDLHDIKNHNESKKEDDDFLGDSGEKHKTYVHRRNKRLSTVLNIIMLGSVITAAGVAIGHMWGAKTDCSMHTSPNVNKILSNLYKLQEENAYLWNKLKELTALNNHQMNQQKTTLKQNKCKKIFEEPLINNDSKKVTKCVDSKFINDDKLLNKDMDKTAHEQQFSLEDGNNIHVYQKNKKWLDDETLQTSNQKPPKKLKTRHTSKSLKHNAKNQNKENYLNEIIDVTENSQNEKKNTEEYLNETEDLSNAITLNYIDNINIKEREAFKSEHKYLNGNNKLHKRPYGPEKDFSSNYVDKLVNAKNKDQFKNYKSLKGEYAYELDLPNKGKNTKTNFNSLNEEYNLFNDFISPKRHHNVKKRESNKTFKVETKDFDTNQISKDKFGTEEELLSNIKDKKQKKKSFKSINKAFKKNSKDFDKGKTTEEKEFAKIVNNHDKAFEKEYKKIRKNKTPNGEYDTEEEERNMTDDSLKKIKREDNKTLQQKNIEKIKYETPKGKYDTAERITKNLNPNGYNQKENELCEMNTKSFYTNEGSKGESGTTENSLTNIKDNKVNSEKACTMKIKDLEWNETPKNENDSKINNDFIKDKKATSEDHYQSDISDEDLKKDNRYIGQKQKEERKKYDRPHSHKKVKRRNKYEQWEMKGGLFKDYDDISMSSSQENEYSFNKPNKQDDKNRIRQVGDNSYNAEGNLNHDPKDYVKSTQKGNEDEDEVNWVDKRAKFRTEARQRLDQEAPDKNGVNAASWYFRRMRKREQSRGKVDSSYRKLLKTRKL